MEYLRICPSPLCSTNSGFGSTKKYNYLWGRERVSVDLQRSKLEQYSLEVWIRTVIIYPPYV